MSETSKTIVRGALATLVLVVLLAAGFMWMSRSSGQVSVPEASTVSDPIVETDQLLNVRVITAPGPLIARGLLFPWKIGFSSFGENDDVPDNEFQLLGPNDRTSFPWPQVALPVRARAGGNAADDVSSGSGARQILIECLDENWDIQVHIVDLNGTSVGEETAPGNWFFGTGGDPPGSTVGSGNCYRINFSKIVGGGLYNPTGGRGSNVGDIDIENTAGTLLRIIKAGDGQARTLLFTVPHNYTMTIFQVDGHVGNEKTLEVRVNLRFNADVFVAPFGDVIEGEVRHEVTTDVFRRTDWPGQIPEKTDFWYTVQGVTGSSSATARVVATLHRNPSSSAPQAFAATAPAVYWRGINIRDLH